MPDKVWLTRKKAVNQKLEDILGLDYRQFKQVSMIAQEEFMNLLLAKVICAARYSGKFLTRNSTN